MINTPAIVCIYKCAVALSSDDAPPVSKRRASKKTKTRGVEEDCHSTRRSSRSRTGVSYAEVDQDVSDEVCSRTAIGDWVVRAALLARHYHNSAALRIHVPIPSAPGERRRRRRGGKADSPSSHQAGLQVCCSFRALTPAHVH